MINDAGSVVESYDFYPFGLKMPNRTYIYNQGSDKNLFTGKELDNETGNYYFGFRYYNPAEGRWSSVDALAGMYPSQGTYNYCFNAPLNYIDRFGLGNENGVIPKSAPTNTEMYGDGHSYYVNGVEVGRDFFYSCYSSNGYQMGGGHWERKLVGWTQVNDMVDEYGNIYSGGPLKPFYDGWIWVETGMKMMPDIFKQVYGATMDFKDQYKTMREENIIGNDHYHHAMANSKAALRGIWGKRTAIVISNLRESFDLIKGNTFGDVQEDQIANRHGRSIDINGNPTEHNVIYDVRRNGARATIPYNIYNAYTIYDYIKFIWISSKCHW